MTAEHVARSRLIEEALGVPPLIRCNGKRPLDRDWTKGPIRDASNWRRRLEPHEDNVGMLTGNGYVAVDVDLQVPGAQDSFDELRRLGLPIQTVTTLTPSGGRHLLYRTATPIPSRPLEGFPGIDIKGEGGMVIVPPSRNVDTGRPYEYEFGWGVGDVDPAGLSPDLIDLFLSGGRSSSAGPLDERDEEAVNLLLEHFGGHSPHQRDGWIELTRPGKEAHLGGSATVGAVGHGVARVWSTNWPELPAGAYGLNELRKLAGIDGPKVHVPTLEPPEGYRWWRSGDDDRRVPTLGADAYHGSVGEYMAHVAEHSEAHPAAVGFTILAYLGVWLERSVIYTAGRAIRHHPNLWGALVGETSSGGKGVAGDTAELLLDEIDPMIVRGHSINGIASGPALIDRLRPEEEGQPPRRVVVHEHELANVLKLCEREGSTLSGDLRKAFDLKPIGNHTRGHGDRTAEGYFLGAIGSITPTELHYLLTTVSIENGFANRWLLLHCEIGEPTPLGDTIDDEVLRRVAATITNSIVGAIGATYRITPDLVDIWRPFYLERRKGLAHESSIVRSFANRQPAHAARLAITFAGIDGSPVLRPSDLHAAIAWCDYALDTVRYVFGSGMTGHARKLLDAIRRAGRKGLSRTDQSAVFGRHLDAEELDAVCRQLEAAHLVHTVEVPTAGRPATVSFAIARIGHGPCEAAKEANT